MLQIPVDASKPLTLTVMPQDLQIIMAGLDELPHKVAKGVSFRLLQMIQNQPKESADGGSDPAAAVAADGR